MTEKELQDILSQIEDIIADDKGNVCHRVVDIIHNIKMMYPYEEGIINERIKKCLAKHNIVCPDLEEINGRKIVDYVENNVPLAEPLNN